LTELRHLNLADNRLGGSIPTQIGRLDVLYVLDLYNNQLTGDPPPSIARLINLKQLFVDKEQLTALRLFYCRQRFPRLGKYSYRMLREEYHRFAQAVCEQPYSVVQAFGSLDEMASDV